MLTNLISTPANACDLKWLKRALLYSLQSTHDRHYVAAIVVRGHAHLSRATNGPPSIHGQYRSSRHAEARALKDQSIDYNGATIYVARHGAGMSRPCKNCMALILKSGISKIVYLNWNSVISVEKV